jgi:hypothetical protein
MLPAHVLAMRGQECDFMLAATTNYGETKDG